MLNRRGFIGALTGVLTGAVLDPEKLLWVPGEKHFSIPRPRNRGVTVVRFDGIVAPGTAALAPPHGPFPLQPAGMERKLREAEIRFARDYPDGLNFGGQSAFPVIRADGCYSGSALAYSVSGIPPYQYLREFPESDMTDVVIRL